MPAADSNRIYQYGYTNQSHGESLGSYHHIFGVSTLDVAQSAKFLVWLKAIEREGR